MDHSRRIAAAPNCAPNMSTILIFNRILDNAHLLDATEIFRKLNVHKKVSLKSTTGFRASDTLARNHSSSLVSTLSCSSSTFTP